MLTWIEISGEHLRQNLRAFSKIMGPQRLAPVLKSNAYGHGLKEVYRALAGEQLEWISVNYVNEGEQLRAAGYSGRVLVVGPFIPHEIEAAYRANLDLFLGHHEGLSAWLASRVKPKVHIEFDTGMGRQGFRPDDAGMVADLLLAHKDHVKGVCMHFANVEDVTEHEYARLQLAKFAGVKQEFLRRGMQCISHAASSASVLILEDSRFDLARFGISLYGFWPSQATRLSYMQLHGGLVDLKPVLSWRTKITSLNRVSHGQYIGYGCTFKARHDMTIAVLPVGYFEGYPRMASGGQAYVLIHGERCPIVGRICMNMMMVDVTDLASKVSVLDDVTLIGRDGLETILASDVATWAQTIHYELVTRLNPAIERRIV
jgi:alanine racemase